MQTAQHRSAAAHLAQLVEFKALPRPWTIYEDFFYRALRGLLAAEALRLARDILSGGATISFSAQWWADHSGRLLPVVANSFEDLTRYGVLAARRQLGSTGIAVNWDLVNQEAVAWARENAAQLVTNVTVTTRAGVRQAVADWGASGESLASLAERIQALTDPATGLAFSPKRAATIAQTESTNIFAQGNARAWVAMGAEPAAYTPAAHVNCRCYMQPWRRADGRTVMVWYTAVDERVCVQPIDTPWGEVEGCKALHLTVVSGGDLMGSKRT